MILCPGDVIHADLRLIATHRLQVDQSPISGESLPVCKDSEPGGGERTGPLNRPEMCFAGTSVVSGSGTALVIATGPQTFWGAATRAANAARPPSSVDAGVKSVGNALLRFMAVMVPIVLAVSGWITGQWAHAGLFAVSVAVGLTPELLPVIVAATFLRGAANLTKRRVILKRPESICDLGAIDMLCVDKTGTLTEDRVAYAYAVDIDGRPDAKSIPMPAWPRLFRPCPTTSSTPLWPICFVPTTKSSSGRDSQRSPSRPSTSTSDGRRWWFKSNPTSES